MNTVAKTIIYKLHSRLLTGNPTDIFLESLNIFKASLTRPDKLAPNLKVRECLLKKEGQQDHDRVALEV